DSVLGSKIEGTIDRTDQRSDVVIPIGYLPENLQPFTGKLRHWLHDALPNLVDDDGGLTVGPIPKGVPVNLISNLKLRAESSDPSILAAHAKDAADLVIKLKLDLANASRAADDATLIKQFADLKAPMLKLSKCPDFVVNRGHY